MVINAVVLAVLGGRADSAQDNYTLQAPNGLALSDFRGYEDWQVVAVSQTDDLGQTVALVGPRIDERNGELERLRAGLTECIGCGCLSLDRCQLANPEDRAARLGPVRATGSATGPPRGHRGVRVASAGDRQRGVPGLRPRDRGVRPRPAATAPP